MGNPLSHVGQTARPEVSDEVKQHCEQVQSQQQAQGGLNQRQSTTDEPPASRLPQHPQQQQDDPSEKPAEQQRIRQQGETQAEDTALPSPTQAD